MSLCLRRRVSRLSRFLASTLFVSISVKSQRSQRWRLTPVYGVVSTMLRVRLGRNSLVSVTLASHPRAPDRLCDISTRGQFGAEAVLLQCNRILIFLDLRRRSRACRSNRYIKTQDSYSHRRRTPPPRRYKHHRKSQEKAKWPGTTIPTRVQSPRARAARAPRASRRPTTAASPARAAAAAAARGARRTAAGQEAGSARLDAAALARVAARAAELRISRPATRRGPSAARRGYM